MDLYEMGHHIECQLRRKNHPNDLKTIVHVGPYNNLDDAQEDMEFITHEKD